MLYKLISTLTKVGGRSALVVACFDTSKGEDPAKFVPNCAILLITHITPVFWVFKRVFIKLAAALVNEILSWSVPPCIAGSKFVLKLLVVRSHPMSVLAGRNADFVLFLKLHFLLLVIFNSSLFFRAS